MIELKDVQKKLLELIANGEFLERNTTLKIIEALIDIDRSNRMRGNYEQSRNNKKIPS